MVVKLLVINHEFPPVGGGAAPVAWELCRHLAGLGHRVDVVTTQFADLPAREERDGVTIYRTSARRHRADRAETLEMASFLRGAAGPAQRLIEANGYDLIHAHFIIPAGYLAGRLSRKTGIPLVITAHGSDVPGYNPDRFKLIYHFIKPFWRRWAQMCPLIISPSEALKQLILRYAPAARVQVIPNGIDLSFLMPAEKVPALVMCSRLLPRKGFQHALTAIEGLHPAGWRVDLIGDGVYRDDLEKQARAITTPVQFHGWLDNRSEVFNRIFSGGEIFIFPSVMENFPTVLLEAMAAGMAIITTNAAGCREVVGDAALLVEPGDVNGLRDALRLLVDNSELRRQMQRKALERVKAFRWEGIAQRYMEVFSHMISEGSR
ncbi:MAG: glycosyltransferase family 4 protein [Sedimentisphaerales bacterium]|nr:glycosyltransferase family 4 protein [Sedimentisphaerales bacterium]